jgi:hypothetical protein
MYVCAEADEVEGKGWIVRQRPAESPAEDVAKRSGPSVMPAFGAEAGEEFVEWAVGSVESSVES